MGGGTVREWGGGILRRGGGSCHSQGGGGRVLSGGVTGSVFHSALRKRIKG